ncbi:MAG: alpha/beta fold hydrolase [Verrucomicrobia bacterium]|nr:alpha/beta fold hydrolase [Verrucomicrobiota bacterium]
MVAATEIPSWLHAMYPFAPRSFGTPRGARMSYLDEGPRADEAVLLLHGNPTWSFYYRNLIRALAPDRRCVAPDHIGMGLSDKPARYDYSLAGRVADVEALVRSLGLRKVHLVVHDWGGAIGFGYATRHPESIGRIVVTNTAAFASPHLPRRIALCRAPGIGSFLVRGLNGFAWPATRMAMHARALSPAERRAYLLPYDSWAHRVAVEAFVRDIPMGPGHPSWTTLQEIEASLPCLRDRAALVVWGRRDFCFHDWFLQRWQEVYPHAEVTAFADAGHYVLEDEPAAVGRITEFLRRA